MTDGFQSWEVQTFTGVGKTVVRIESIQHEVLVHFQTGESVGHISLEGISQDGSTAWLGVNDVGQYSGVNLYDGSRGILVAFSVTCEVGWSLAVRPVSDARVWSDGQITGLGDDVLVLPDAGRGFSTVAINASSEDNTGVWAYGNESGNLLFNFIGPSEQESVLPSDAWVIAVKSNAPWGMSRG